MEGETTKQLMSKNYLLVKNSVICGCCNEEIQSLFRHDFKMCSCGKTFVDGGVLGYYARIGGDNFKDTSVCCNKNDIACIREHVTWGTYGKSGKEKLKRVLIKDLTSEHIEAILETQLGLSEVLKSIFEMELEYRAKKSTQEQL